MALLSKCYEEGDWTRLQSLIKEIIKQYDQNGYARRAALLIEASQNALSAQDNTSAAAAANNNNLMTPACNQP